MILKVLNAALQIIHINNGSNDDMPFEWYHL